MNASKVSADKERALIPSALRQATWRPRPLLAGMARVGGRVGLVLLGIFMMALPIYWRLPGGGLDPMGATLAPAGLGVALMGVGQGTRWQPCMSLLAAALVGQASALGLRHSPPHGILEHFFPWRELLTSPRGLLLLGPLSQTVIMVAAGWRSRRFVESWIRRLISTPHALILAGVMAFSAANFSQDILRYIGEVGLAVWILTVNAVNLVLVVAAIPTDILNAASAWIRCRFASAPKVDGALCGWDRLFPWGVALGVTGMSAALAWLVFERMPHIPDDVSYLFQAKYFARGHLYLPAPSDAKAFDLLYVINDGTKWYGYGFPGWPAVLALGVLAGAPWLVNPILAGITILLTHALVHRLYSRPLAHAAILLLAVSPWFLFMSATFMTHPVTLVWSLSALLGVEKARETGRNSWGVIAGASLGALLLTRPLEGILIGAVVALWSLGAWGRRLSLRGLAGLALAAALIGGLVLPYNALLTGKPTYFPMEQFFDQHWYPGANRLGFGRDIGNVGWVHLDPLPGHGPLDVIVNANQNLYLLNLDLFGWGFGSLLFALAMGLWGRWSQADRLFRGVIFAVIGGYSFYFFSGAPDLGPRYWYQILVPMVVLSLRGIQATRERLLASGATPIAASRVVALVVMASLVAIITMVPSRSLGKYFRYRGMSPEVARLARLHRFDHGLVFVQERFKYDYASASVFNPPSLDSPGTIYVRDPGPAGRVSVAQHFPDRPIWIVAGSAIPGGSFSLLAGPLPPLSAGRAGSLAGHP